MQQQKYRHSKQIIVKTQGWDLRGKEKESTKQ